MGEARRVRVLLNHQSGSGGISPETICAGFAAEGCGCEVTELSKKVDLAALAKSDVAEVAWVAAGGDGTVNCVAHATAGTGRVMGVLPMGTLNHFAQDLGIPMKVGEATAVATNGEVRAVDAAEVNGATFVNNSSLGVYPAMAMERDRMRKSGLNKWWSLVVASTHAFVRFRCLSVDVEVDGELRHYTTPLLFVGNNAYEIDGGRIGCRERMDAGLLSLILVPHTTRLAMLRLCVAAIFGRIRGAGELEEFAVKSFTVRAKTRRLRVSLDGEVRRMPPPLRYSAKAGALRVIVPAGGLAKEGA